LLLRLALGSLFIMHGYQKLRGLKGAAGWLKSMGLPGEFAIFGAVVEFFGGIALLLGIATSVIATLFALWMLSTSLLQKVKMKKGYVGGYELDITLLIASLALAAIGGGTASLAHLFGI
jgi:uncharacterized membrane protein YphA (DoxX/SURF4 family)